MPDPTRAAIFDLDGTLIDTYDAHHAAWRTACAANDIELTPAMFAWSFGRTNPTIIRRFWADAGRPDPDDATIERVAEAKETDFRTELDRSFPAMPGVPELIAGLREQDFALAIGTSAPRENLELAADRLGITDLIDASVCGGEVVHGKPDPEVFLLAAERLGASPAQCVVMEDAGAGIDAAKAAGMSSIGIVSTGRTAAELDHADLVVDRFDVLRPADFLRLLAGR
ncbi:MAG: HAD family phosphatase [Phycisphaeraceae bacterium]|nr:HAD family phosphatase [Phycisphaeraceae bacterium]